MYLKESVKRNFWRLSAREYHCLAHKPVIPEIVHNPGVNLTVWAKGQNIIARAELKRT
jgi:hypothetical protein